MNTNLKATLVEVFTKQITNSVRFSFNNLITTFGPTMSGVANSRQYRLWSETVRPCCDRSSNRIGADYSLSEERLASFAARLSNDMADDVLNKVDAKVGQLDTAAVTYVSGANFLINGSKNGRGVSIEQNQIINVSVKGKLFNQYPSRIYVEGKFMSAAKFAQI